MTNYPVGDFLIQIKNAGLADNKYLVVRTSKLIEAVAKVLKKKGILTKIDKKENNLEIHLAYHKKEPVLMDIKIVSRPGLRKYSSVDEIRNRKRRNASFLVVSTSRGVMSSDETKKAKIGGEVIAEVW